MGASSHLGTLGIKKTFRINLEEIYMDYREADAIWNGIVDKFTLLEDVDELTKQEERLYKVYKKACEGGQIGWKDMYKLRDDLNYALKLRNL